MSEVVKVVPTLKVEAKANALQIDESLREHVISSFKCVMDLQEYFKEDGDSEVKSIVSDALTQLGLMKERLEQTPVSIA